MPRDGSGDHGYASDSRGPEQHGEPDRLHAHRGYDSGGGNELDNFKALIGQPRTIRNKAFAAKTVLGDLFDEANNLLNNQLDKLMIRFKFTDPDFYEEYTRARVIVD
ncbi:hypothetical protein [Prolixibacter bellariivorans]|uniref:hypothetical protein n=1 Tax=Prolixibacter bellariivorans TaxID=314319 RepID=UPI00046F6DB3|nr:hypothetical protein [Prolixibacter bellariivorans]